MKTIQHHEGMKPTSLLIFNIHDALHDLVPFVQFKKREKHPWRNLIFTKFAGLACNFAKSNTPPLVFFMFFKLYKWYQIVLNIT